MVPIEQSGEPIMAAQGCREFGPCSKLVAVRWIRLRRFVVSGSSEIETINKAAKPTTPSIWDMICLVMIGLFFFFGAGAILNTVTGWETAPMMLGSLGVGLVIAGAMGVLVFAVCHALRAIGVGGKRTNKSEWTQANERRFDKSWRTFERSDIDTTNSNLHSFDHDLTWRKIGPRAEIGRVKLGEDGRCNVFGVERRAFPNRAVTVRCNEEGNLTFKFDGADWYLNFYRSDPKPPTEEEVYQEISAGIGARDVQVFETYKTLAEELSGGRAVGVVSGVLYLAVGSALYFIFGWTIPAVIVGGLGALALVIAIWLANLVKVKYIVIVTDVGVVKIKADKFEAKFLDSLRRQEVEGAVYTAA
jgi:hypothetical protein